MTYNFLFLLLAIIFNAGASTFFKYSSLEKNNNIISIILLLIGLIFGALNAVFYTKSLRSINLNTAYTVFSAGSIILITTISLILFKEAISIKKIIGIIVIIIGILVVTK